MTESLNDSEIKPSRIERLNNIAESLSSVYSDTNALNLSFICTHNSRRSQLAQVWSYYFSYLYHLNIHSYSSGTEVTMVHPNILNVLEEAGFEIKKDTKPVDNPIFKLSFSKKGNLIELFSKSIDDESLPKNYIAITTCSQADENCPFIPQASLRFPLTYADPGSHDGSDREMEFYRETNMQIAREIKYLIKKIKTNE